MLMGAGKSSVVSPLLGLLLADGDALCTVVVPSSLIEQAVGMLGPCKPNRPRARHALCARARSERQPTPSTLSRPLFLVVCTLAKGAVAAVTTLKSSPPSTAGGPATALKQNDLILWQAACWALSSRAR